ncbi:Fibronectin type III domain-containing protein [Jatrophihabitans endophyticus]|uniref:Fibronectin type III domain-containing protein n=1 Tax=Jatrophihabitans endophyticus TaxID=1206085 RepID=A0A1M5PGE5_9ACTN|nr:fibronectin type III domain-containing protein [Jatrophihabitans endophyticus]SHH00852.1 Fibronectin type III domain-containing protein [Jatrophihabitans endophyticus]
MVGARWRDAAAFSTAPGSGSRRTDGSLAARPSRRQAVALLAALAVVCGSVAAVSYLVEPDDARSFDLFGGSVLLADAVAPVSVDLASGRPTVRLVDASAQVGAQRAEDVAVEPMADGALLLDKQTGEFNIVDSTGFVLKKDGGVPLPRRAGATGASAVAARDFAYVQRTGPTGTSVYLVGATTVQGAASGATARPRAFLSLPDQVSSAPGTAATAGNDLWVLAGTGSTRTLRHLSLPADSATGARLRSQRAATVDGPAAVASLDEFTGVANATTDVKTTGTVDSPVAVAARDHITVFWGDGQQRTARYAAPAGVDTVLAATNASSRIAFLLHGSRGWSVVSVAPDGTGLRGPTPLGNVPAGARLVTPAVSGGSLYTLGAASGGLWRIGLDGSAERLPGLASYPVARQDGRAVEAAGFGDAYVVARGPRVIVNSPNHQLAVGVFTDGSRRPVRIDKSAAVTISSGGGAEALTRSRNDDVPTPQPGRSTAAPKPVAPVTNLVDCSTTSQKPHIPAFTTSTPGSRSVALAWTYPITDRTDCVPRTYVVTVRSLRAGAPQPPSRVTVDGQQSVNLAGLFPSTLYELTVTAYINGKGTSSAPIRVTTGPEGPAAPRTVTARADSSGNWSIGWRSCGTVSAGCVPSASWRVVPQFCDGLGLSTAPAAIDAPADPTTTVQPAAVLRGGSALLGRGLRFQVEGIGTDGTVGTPSASTGCVTSWAPPRAGDLRLTASKPADAAVGATSSTTVSLSLGSDPIAAVGGVGAKVTFTLSGGGSDQTYTTVVSGRASTLTHTFADAKPGVTYTAKATVSPPGHPAAAVSVTADGVTARATWPTPSVSASCPRSSSLDLTCTLAVTLGGFPTNGETFALADGSVLRCGEATLRLTDGSFDSGSLTATVKGVSQLQNYYGSCTVTAGVVETSGGTLLYGGVPSPLKTVDVSLGAPASLDLAAGDFAAAWPDSGSSARVNYTGSANLDALTTGWALTLHAPDGSVCGTSNSEPNPTTVSAGDCVQPYGDQSGWYVSLTYRNTTDGGGHSVDRIPLSGGPPSYQPCTVAASDVTATWGATIADGVTVGATGSLAGCTGWRYELLAPDGTSCGTTTGSPADSPAPNITLTCGTAPSSGDWSVAVSWNNPNGTSGDAKPTVTGDPPTS